TASDSDGQLAVEVRTLKSVQFVKGAVGASARVHVDHAQLGTGVGGIARDRSVLGQRPLAA
ncbi:hypothetical protein, partial [Klebsiella quasipneumoniae]|uniref:hypothetical protein n=1 Tax=Klebsiella quasipneumoniae TaxID=1463165 RepID=UPI0027305C6A